MCNAAGNPPRTGSEYIAPVKGVGDVFKKIFFVGDLINPAIRLDTKGEYPVVGSDKGLKFGLHHHGPADYRACRFLCFAFCLKDGADTGVYHYHMHGFSGKPGVGSVED